jgi:hypothetical protein
LDTVVETKAPFQPGPVVEQHCRTLKAYRVQWVMGDKYAGKWPEDRFLEHAVFYRHSDRSKSDIFVDSLPFLRSRKLALLKGTPEAEKLKGQLVGLDRKTSRAGKDSIDHERGGHDDVANAACGALLMASDIGSKMDAPPKKRREPQNADEAAAAMQAERLARIWAMTKKPAEMDHSEGPTRYSGGGGW